MFTYCLASALSSLPASVLGGAWSGLREATLGPSLTSHLHPIGPSPLTIHSQSNHKAKAKTNEIAVKILVTYIYKNAVSKQLEINVSSQDKKSIDISNQFFFFIKL